MRTAEADHRAFLERGRFGSLDGVRCISIAAVLWHHSPLMALFENGPRFAARGFLGVDFFFVLSGFLITTLLLREERREGRFSLSGFYWRRVLRILPPFYASILFVIAYKYLADGHFMGWGKAMAHFLFLTNFLAESEQFLGISWSLSVEEQYYLLWPLILLTLPRRWLGPGLALMVAVNVIAVIGWLAPLGVRAIEAGIFRFALPNATYAPILIGSGLALTLADRRGFALLYRLLAWPGAPLAAFAALAAVIAAAPADVRGFPNLAIHLAMAAALASLVVREDHALAPFMRFRPVARIGEISYGLYLYHLFGLHVAFLTMKALGWESLSAMTALYVAASIVIAEASFRTLERFFMSFRKRRPWSFRRAAVR